VLHHASRSLRIRGAVATFALAALVLLPLPAAAREAVDPATLTPAPNPAADPVCGWSGDQVICRSELRFTVTDAETGIFCGGGQLLESSERHTLTQRFYNADLLLTKKITQEWIEGVLYVAETGESVRWTGTDTGIQNLRVPGDPGTGTGINSGANMHLYLAGGGSITSAGRTIEDFDTGAFTSVGSNPDGVDFCAVIA
jgi:hypothetical protein